MAKQDTDQRAENLYSQIIAQVFKAHYKPGMTQFEFKRSELVQTAEALGVSNPKNLGDLIYSFRFRTKLPQSIQKTAKADLEWVIELAGTAIYRFRLTKVNRITPSANHYQIKIPDATPEIIRQYALTDEQAVLAKVRYNRLIDIFLGVTAYSLQNHLRTSVPKVGQIELDEVYVGIRRTGEQFIIPVQAKGGTDQIGAVQLAQDLALCTHVFPMLTPRLVAVQYQAKTNAIVMFELVIDGDDLKVMEERHYVLVPGASISGEDLKTMAKTD